MCVALMFAYPGTTHEYWAGQDHAIVVEAMRLATPKGKQQ